MLEPLGLSPLLAELYRTVLDRPGLSVEELTEHLNWSAEHTRSALDECVRLSLIRPSWETPGKLRPVHPEVGLRALLSRHEADVLERQRQLAQARAEVTRLVDEYAARQRVLDPGEIERLDGIDAVRARIEELTHACTSSLLAFHPGGAQTPSNRAASRPLVEMLVGRGVVMRTVYLDSLYNDPQSVEHARFLVDMGNHVRTTASLPFRMLVFDREHALVPIDPDVSARGALLFSSPGILAGLCALFDLVWEKAVPLSGAKRLRQPGDGGDELTSQEAAVLRLLGEGYTDEVVARKLGVSVRTGRRITADLMGRLGAKSRFQAGMRAVQFGWVGTEDEGADGVGAEPGAESGAESGAGAKAEVEAEVEQLRQRGEPVRTRQRGEPFRTGPGGGTGLFGSRIDPA